LLHLVGVYIVYISDFFKLR